MALGSNKSIGNIIGKLNTLIIMELFFTWCPIADTRVKQLDMLNDPRTKRHKKNEVDAITFPINGLVSNGGYKTNYSLMVFPGYSV